MKKHNPIIDLALQCIIALSASILLFSLVPLLDRFFSQEAKPTEESIIPQYQILAQIKTEKQKPKKIQTQKIQRNTHIKGKPTPTTQASLSPFVPDLGIGGNDNLSTGMGSSLDMIFEEGETDEPPIPLRQSAIAYPRAAKIAKIEGLVEITYIINRNGSVDSIAFQKYPHQSFKKPIEKVIKTWKFRPARVKGVAVAVRARQTINFQLEKQL